MLLPKKFSKFKIAGYIAVIVVMVAVILYLLYANFLADWLKPAAVSPESAAAAPELQFIAPQVKTEFKTDFLSKPPFASLKAAGQLPVTAEVVGNANPFSVAPAAASQTGR